MIKTVLEGFELIFKMTSKRKGGLGLLFFRLKRLKSSLNC